MARCCSSFFAKREERAGSSLSPYALSARYKLLNVFLASHAWLRCFVVTKSLMACET